MISKKLYVLLVLALFFGCTEGQKNPSTNEEVNCLKIDIGLSDAEVINRVSVKKQQPDLLLLKKVHLPKNASLCQKRDFVDQILYFSSNQRNYLETDPQVQMIMEALKGSEAEFLSLARPNWHSANSYISDAYIRLLSETQNKAFVKQHFTKNPWLIKVITKNSWSGDFKESIIAYVETKNGNVSYEFATAFVQLEDPATEDLIRKSLLNSSGNRHIFYKKIRELQWLDLSDSLKQIWNSDNVTTLELQYLAYPLGKMGYLPVLDYLVSNINGTTYDNPYRKNINYLNYLTNMKLDKESAKDWYKAHSDSLKFDPESRKFIVDDAK
jgi:hypothetical protein